MTNCGQKCKKVIKTARSSEIDNFVIDQCSLQTTPGRIIPWAPLTLSNRTTASAEWLIIMPTSLLQGQYHGELRKSMTVKEVTLMPIAIV